MKSAAGEANLTVIAIILITVVVSIATPIIMSLMKRQTWKACCTDAGGVVKGRTCTVNETVYDGPKLVSNDRCIDIEKVENK